MYKQLIGFIALALLIVGVAYVNWPKDQFGLSVSTISQGGTGTSTAPTTVGDTFTWDGSHWEYGTITYTAFGTDFYTYFHATTTDYLTQGSSNLYSTQANWDTFWNASSTNSSLITLSSLALPYAQISDFRAGWDSIWNASTTIPSIQTLANLSITKSQVSDFGSYENPLTFNYPITRATNAISLSDMATSTITCSGSASCGAGSYVIGSALTITGSGLTTIGSGTNGKLAYWSGANTLTDIATTTLTATAPIVLSNPISVIGSAASALTCTTASSGVGGCLSNTAFDTFNNKQATISATWPITLTGAAVGFNGLSTSTAAVLGNIPYFSGVNTFANAATSSKTCTSPLSCTAFDVVGSGSGAITLSTAGDWTGTFDGQQGTWYSDANNLTDFGTPFYTYFNATSTDALSVGSTNLYATQAVWDTHWNASSTNTSLTSLANLTTVGTIGTGTWTGSVIADAYISDTLTVTGYMEDTDINTLAKLNAWLPGETVASTTQIWDISSYTNLSASGGVTLTGDNLTADLGTSIDLTSEVTGILPYANGGTATSTIAVADSYKRSKQAIIYDAPTAVAAIATTTPMRFTCAGFITDINAFNTTAGTATSTIDINNTSGVSILSTNLTIDPNETDSSTAVYPVVITTPAIANGTILSVQVDTAGASSAGLSVVIYYTCESRNIND